MNLGTRLALLAPINIVPMQMKFEDPASIMDAILAAIGKRRTQPA
jgi:hypothetical protein